MFGCWSHDRADARASGYLPRVSEIEMAIAWVYQYPNSLLTRNPIVDGAGNTYFLVTRATGYKIHTLISLDKAGKVRWQAQKGTVLSQWYNIPTGYMALGNNGKLYCTATHPTNNYSYLYAFNTLDGSAGSYDHAGYCRFARSVSPPVIGNDRVIVCGIQASDGRFGAVGYSDTLTEEWVYRTTRVNFDAGTDAITAGSTITGGTSGAGGTVSQVVITSGSWAGDDAAGYIDICLNAISYNRYFINNEALTTDGGGAATSASGENPIAFDMCDLPCIAANGVYICGIWYPGTANYRWIGIDANTGAEAWNVSSNKFHNISDFPMNFSASEYTMFTAITTARTYWNGGILHYINPDTGAVIPGGMDFGAYDESAISHPLGVDRYGVPVFHYNGHITRQGDWTANSNATCVSSTINDRLYLWLTPGIIRWCDLLAGPGGSTGAEIDVGWSGYYGVYGQPFSMGPSGELYYFSSNGYLVRIGPEPAPATGCQGLAQLLVQPDGNLGRSAQASPGDRLSVRAGAVRQNYLRRSCPDLSPGDRVNISPAGTLRKSKGN